MVDVNIIFEVTSGNLQATLDSSMLFEREGSQ